MESVAAVHSVAFFRSFLNGVYVCDRMLTLQAAFCKPLSKAGSGGHSRVTTVQGEFERLED